MKKICRLFMGLLACVLTVTPFLGKKVFAAEGNANEKTQIIFLLDASQSMGKEEGWQDAADNACMISSVLPRYYEAALLVYNSEILYCEDFGNVGQSTRNALEKIEMGGYTAPGVALETAISMFDTDTTNKRVVFISDGEISMREAESTEEALGSYEAAVETAAGRGIRIDMFALPNEDTTNEVSQGTVVTSGEMYTAGEFQTLEDIAVKYLFDLLQIERVDLGEARSVGEKITVDLQDTYMENAKILLVAGEKIQDFHVMGQCEEVSNLQGNKVAVAKLTNPIKDQVTIDYVLENRAEVHAYLIKEYDLKAEIGQAYTSESGVFDIEVNILNHQNKQILDAENLKDNITFSINGIDAEYRVEDKKALLTYRTAETQKISVEAHAETAGSILHTSSMAGDVVLTVPVIEEEPDYTVLWIVIAVLAGLLMLLTLAYVLKKKTAQKQILWQPGKKKALYRKF